MHNTTRESPETDTEKVIVMDRFRSGRSLSPLRQAEAYWNALREEGGVPKRTQIDPRGLENILEYAFILERVTPRVARFRLAGQHLAGLAGMDVRGMPLASFFTDAARSDLMTMLGRLFGDPSVAELVLAGEDTPGCQPVRARMILLPLKTDQGEIARALGVLVADAAAYRVPCRFAIREFLIRPVSGMAADAPDQRPPVATPDAMSGGFAEAQTRLQGRSPHLRLVK